MPKPMSQASTNEVTALPDNDRRQRRRFSRDQKLKILAEADRCTGRGELAALLRREGIYSGQVNHWRQQLRALGESGLDSQRPGRKAKQTDRERQIESLERKNKRLEHELLVAKKLIELAGKAHEILGVALPSLEDEDKR